MIEMGSLSVAITVIGIFVAAAGIRRWAEESRARLPLQDSPWSVALGGCSLALGGLAGILLSWMGSDWRLVAVVVLAGSLVSVLFFGANSLSRWANRGGGDARQ